jgi:hypothetical protein
MNSELIRKLAGKAYVAASLELQFADPATWYSDRGPTQDMVNAKLAELIVRECARVVNDNNFAGSTLGDRLLFEHFGVES